MKTLTLLRVALPVICLLSASAPAMAYQIADGIAPSAKPAAKYIFYWGKHQCDLSEANQFKASLLLTATSFRQLLVGEPRLWNGKELLKNVTFKLDDIPVTTTDYVGQLAYLDTHLGPKAQPGKILHLTELRLEEGIKGAIDITIETANSPETRMTYGYGPVQRNHFLNEQFLDRVVWGREDIYETSDRDYFTVREFWQTIRQEPAVEWKSYLQPRNLRCLVDFTSKDKATLGMVCTFEEGAYRGMLDHLEHYRHMVDPGAVVTLQLQILEQYDLLFKKVIHIVSDDDPRLRLRRKRDQHELHIQWGEWSEKIQDLYLTNLTNAQGERVSTDMPIARNMSMSFFEDRQINWGKTQPEYTIDGESYSGDLSFRVTVSDSLVFYVNSNAYDPDAIRQIFAQKGLVVKSLLIDSIEIEHFDLPPMRFFIYLEKLNDGLLIRNEFNILQIMAGNQSAAKLGPPVVSETMLEFPLDLPDKSRVALSVFEQDGAVVTILYDNLDTGKSTLNVPRNAFRVKGKHFAFLNSIFGVVKVEFEVD